MKGIVLPALTEEQKYFASKILSEIAEMKWEIATKAASSAPGFVFTSDDESLLATLYESLSTVGLKPELRTVTTHTTRPKDRKFMTVMAGVVFAAILALGGFLVLRATRSGTPSRAARAMDLSVSHGEFVVRISNNDNQTAYRNCRVEIDSRYSFPVPTLAQPYARGFEDSIQYDRASYPSLQTLEDRHRIGTLSTDQYLSELKKAEERARGYMGWERGKAYAVGDAKSQISIHLGDFRRGAERYDWQRRAPTRVLMECEEWASIERWTRESHPDIPSGLSVPQWTWKTGLSRWEGALSGK